MDNIFNRLQFVRHEEVFQTREEAYNYVLLHQINGDYPTIENPDNNMPALLGEPMVLLYKNEDTRKGPNVILAIGSAGNGTPDNKNRTYFIDTYKTEEEINEINIQIEDLKKLIGIVAKDSDTLDLNTVQSEEGTVISGNVKIANYQIVDGKAYNNIITKVDDKGIFAFVDMDYDPVTSNIVFNVNGVTKPIQIPSDQHVVSGAYKKEDESIYLKLADGSKIKILVTELIEEWKPFDNGTPIVLNKEHASAITTDHEGIYDWQDILTADVRVADYISDNILHKDGTGRYLYVKGTADNIVYTNGVTVKDALDNADTRVSTSLGNIVCKRDDGIYANVMLDYDPLANKLHFKSTNSDCELSEKVIELNSFKLLEDISYDPLTESIVIRYIDTKGEYHTLNVPVSGIIEEWDTMNEAHNVELNKYRSEGKGIDLLSADVKIHKGNNNILEDLDHKLYVNGVSDNIKYNITGDTTVREVLDSLSSYTDTLNERIEKEITDREASDERFDNTIGSGFTSDPHENITYKFSQLTDHVLTNEVILRQEVNRSVEKDTEHDNAIYRIDSEIGSGFSNTNTIRDEINNLGREIDELSANTEGRLKSIVNTDHSINVDNTDPVNPVIKVNLSEEVEDNLENVIKLNNDGLFATVDLEYSFDEQTGTNRLIFKTTDKTKSIDLKTNSVVDKIYYDPSKEAIIIEYTVNGKRMPDVVVPVGDLISEWRIWDGHEGAIQLSKERKTSGTTEQDILKAEVVISEHDDNILVNDSGSLYVTSSGITKNTNDISVLKDRMDEAETDIDNLENGLAEEIRRATSAEGALDGKIASEIERATREETRIESKLDAEIVRSTAIDEELANSISTNAANIQIEKERAENAERTLRTAITAEETRAVSAETALQIAVNNEIARATNSEANITHLLEDETMRATTAEDALSTAINNEVSRATSEELRIETKLNNEISRSTEKDNSLETSLNTEVFRATSAETALHNEISTESMRATSEEARIETKLNNEISRSIEKDNELNSSINTVNANLENEVTRARSAESLLSESIANEASRAKEAESAITHSLEMEVNRAASAEELIQSNLANEIERAKTAESSLTTTITSEVNRATTRENELYDLITAETANRQDSIDNVTLTFDDTTTVDLNKDSNNIVTANVKIANSDDNIIKADGSLEGIYASVKLSYNPGTNKIKLVTSNGEQEEIQLNAGALLDSLTYDPTNRALVITYTDSNGVQHSLNFPVNELFNDWIVANPSENSAIELTKVVNGSGYSDTLGGRVLLTNLDDNIVKIVNNGLYVSGDLINGRINIISGDVEDIKDELSCLENGVGFGSGTCEYNQSTGCFISAATSLYNADQILDTAICELYGKVDAALKESDTSSAHMFMENDELKTNVRLSHGSVAPGMSDEELTIKSTGEAEITDTNALRIVEITGQAKDSTYNGLYLSSNWDCGEYTLNGEGTPNNKYKIDESEGTFNYNYMNNVRQSDI